MKQKKRIELFQVPRISSSMTNLYYSYVHYVVIQEFLRDASVRAITFLFYRILRDMHAFLLCWWDAWKCCHLIDKCLRYRAILQYVCYAIHVA